MGGRFLLLDLNVNWNMTWGVTGATVPWERQRTRMGRSAMLSSAALQLH